MKRRLTFALLALFALQAAPAWADSDDMMSVLQDMKKQMSEMQRTIETQNDRIRQLESRPSTGSAAGMERPAEAQVSPSLSEQDWEKGIKDNIGNAIPWTKGLKLGGDLRLRAENFNYFEEPEDNVVSDTRDRTRYRFRLRYGVEKDFGDDWKVGFRLASASTSGGLQTDQASTNVTLGNPGYFTYKDIFIDRAYATYSPNGLKDYGMVSGVTIGAGKFDNPFLRYATPIVWDADVTPEGLYEKATLKHWSSENNKVYSHWTLGQFITHENSGQETDAQLYGYQGALAWSTYNFGTDAPVEIASAVTYYDYPNYFQTVGAGNNFSSTAFLRTNTTALDNPKILDFYNEQSFKLGEWPLITLWQDFVSNVGSIDDTRAGNNAVHDADFAWGAGIKLGKMKKKKDWEAHWGWYDIGANAVVAAFNDSDFGGPGGVGHTNRVGQKFGLGYMITDSVTLSYTGYVVSVQDPINSSTIAANATDEQVWRSQVDLLWKF